MDDDFSVFFEQLEAYSQIDHQAAAFDERQDSDNPLTLSEDQLAQLQSDLSIQDDLNNPVLLS